MSKTTWRPDNWEAIATKLSAHRVTEGTEYNQIGFRYLVEAGADAMLKAIQEAQGTPSTR